jgi:hypothetical protein
MGVTAITYASRAAIRTEKSRNYLIQLCKHFGHKIEATYADNMGRIVFNMGVCDLDADDTGVLVAEVSTTDESQLVTLEDIIERHLKRFAFKEELSVQWVRGG